MLLPTIDLMGFIKAGVVFLLFFLVFIQKVNAQTPMEAGLYKIEPNASDLPEIEQTHSSSVVKSYGSYSFGISESLIDFGKIVPTNPLTRKNVVNLDSPAARYFLKTYEDHQLLSPKSGSIADTTCDSGTCSEQTSSVWKNVLAFGFGFHCRNINGACGQEFLSDDYFMQFADKSKNEPYNSLLSGASGKNQLEITYKLNISSKQKPGAYSNNVTLLALPGY